MENEYVTVRSLDSGLVGRIPVHLAEHEVFGARLEVVEDDAKDRISISDLVLDQIAKTEAEDAEDSERSQDDGDPKVYDEFLETFESYSKKED